jgi:hypothetical protein
MAQTQKQGQPNDQNQDEWEQDLHPNAIAGQNSGVASSQPEKDAPNASDIKELHSLLEGYTNDELQQIKVLPLGTRLQQGAKYIDLMDQQRKEFTAMGNMEAGSDNMYVPKTEVDYQLWHRLTGVQKPDVMGEASLS